MERAITRTIKTYAVEVAMYDKVEKTVFPQTFNFTGKCPTEKDVLKFVRNALGNDSQFKPISVESVTSSEALYKMAEEDFIRYATPVLKA